MSGDVRKGVRGGSIPWGVPSATSEDRLTAGAQSIEPGDRGHLTGLPVTRPVYAEPSPPTRQGWEATVGERELLDVGPTGDLGAHLGVAPQMHHPVSGAVGQFGVDGVVTVRMLVAHG